MLLFGKNIPNVWQIEKMALSLQPDFCRTRSCGIILYYMINPRLLKNSARVNSLLNEPRTSALDVGVKRVQGPGNKHKCTNCCGNIDKAEISVNGKVIKVQIVKDESREYKVSFGE